VLAAVADGGTLRVVNHVDVEQYLRGMGEVLDPNWPATALRAQAVAARTYALLAVKGGIELCDDQECQVYLGSQAEYAAMDRAVAATRGQVVLFRAGLAETVYSANGGGVSATPEEGFGRPGQDYPYLRTAPYPTKDPFPWTVRIALGDVAARVGYPGQLTAVKVAGQGPSGRVVQVALEGASGPRTMSGIDFDKALGLRSTLFTLRVEQADAAPPPPPPPEGGGPGPLAPPGGQAAAVPPPPSGAPEPETRWSGPGVALLALATALTLAVGGGAAFVAASGPVRA
jgi:stage II sporulation protein D